MSVIFQLFSVQDLSNLTTSQLDELRNIVGESLRVSPDVEAIPSVRRRIDDVYDQLISSSSFTVDPKSIDLDPSQMPNLEQLLGSVKLSKLSPKQQSILAWAIICEVTHSEDVIAVVKEKTYELFKKYNDGREPIGSDVFYQHEP